MNAHTILSHITSLVTPSLHKSRRNAVMACVKSLMHGAQGSVTSIGRGIESSAYEKHSIKRADRLLSNPHLIRELPLIYTAICQLIGRLSKQPIIHIDWSDLDPNKRHFLIRASVLFSGRSLTLYQEVHSLQTKEKRSTHKAFLSRLKQMLGNSVQPIIVTDAGFKVPWFRQVLALDWHYVGRVRKPNFYKTKSGQWQCLTHIYRQATSYPKVIQTDLCRSNTLATTLVLIKDKAKGRVSMSCFGTRRKNSSSKKYEKSATDPWLLATSLPYTSNVGKRVVNIYHSRMQIEEAFRDMKSSQFGLGYMINKSKILNRISVLVMLVTLANFLLIMVGLTIDTAGQSYKYQANSIKHRRVLSFHSLGVRAMREAKFNFSYNLWKQTVNRLINYIRGSDYDLV